MKSSRPQIKVSRETTYITEPLRADGTVDYVAALNAHCSRGVTVENNAAVCFLRAVGPKEIPKELRPQLFEKLGIPPLPDEGNYLVAFGKAFGIEQPPEASLTDDTGKAKWAALDKAARVVSRPWLPAECPEAVRWIEINEKPLAALIEAAARTRFYSPIVARGDGSPIGLDSNVGIMISSREVAQLLCARAMLHFKLGKIDEAYRDLLACHRLARLLGQLPLLVDTLVAGAVEGLAIRAEIKLLHYGHPTREQIRRLRAELNALPPMPDVGATCLYGERLYYLDNLRHAAQSPQKLLERWDTWQREPSKAVLERVLCDPRIDWDHVFRTANLWLDHASDAHRQPLSLRRAALDKVAQEANRAAASAKNTETLAAALGPQASAEDISRLLAGVLMGTNLSVDSGCLLSESLMLTRQRTRDIALGLAEYRISRGRYPKELGTLVPEYMSELPKDPFLVDGGFHYRGQAASYLLYSVGPSGKDDGGENSLDAPARWENENDAAKWPDDIAIRTPVEK